jgi:hypothetical protein
MSLVTQEERNAAQLQGNSEDVGTLPLKSMECGNSYTWRTRAGAIGGRSTAHFRGRRIFVLTSPWHKDNETEMEMEIACAAKALDKRNGSGPRFLPRNAVFDRLVDVVRTNRGADDRMDRCGQILRRGHPVASRERPYDHPLARRDPGDHLLDEV